MEERVKSSFEQQQFMTTLGAKLALVTEGQVVITCQKRPELTQQNGFVHAGVLTSLMDVACGYAALTVMPADADVLSVEFKTNLLRPAVASELKAIGTVVKAGKTLVFCEAKLIGNDDTLIATMQATMFCVKNE
ncbi:conserved hypothetical protein [Tenacibaculum litopenaei]|jgi:uncharacterized protein (TIGR00369 family)|uniref:PaaI family thioesterase n=1 Tax=Tenacibaculum litopenaei TaxID=396016 RepID=UPI0038941FDD